MYSWVNIKGGSDLEYREKIARVELIALAGAWMPYFVLVWVGPLTALSVRGEYYLYAAVVVVHMVLLLSGRAHLRRHGGDEARIPRDERDRAIALRAYTFAYYALMIAIFAFVVLPFITEGVRSAHLALFAYVLAEAVRRVVVIRSYRTQFA